jgi:site-specific recombinase XerD
MALTLRGATWWIELRVDKTVAPSGRLRQSCKTSDRKRAEQLHKQIETQIWEGTYKPAQSGMTLKQAFNEAVDVHYRGHKSLDTVYINYRAVETILGADTALSTIDTLTLNKLVRKMQAQGLAAGTINRKLAAVSKLLKLAVEWGVLDRVPKIPLQAEAKGRIRYLSAAEEAELLRQLRREWNHEINNSRPWDVQKYRLIAHFFEVLIDTGLRLSEALALEPRDIDLDHRVIHVWENKADKPRSVPMTNRVHAILATLLRETPTAGPFKGLNKSAVDHVFDGIRRRMGLEADKEFVVHALRHTCATRLVKAGTDLRKVQVWMGHKDINTTLRYTHVDTEDLRQGAEALDKHAPKVKPMQRRIGAKSRHPAPIGGSANVDKLWTN